MLYGSILSWIWFWYYGSYRINGNSRFWMHDVPQSKQSDVYHFLILCPKENFIAKNNIEHEQLGIVLYNKLEKALFKWITFHNTFNHSISVYSCHYAHLRYKLNRKCDWLLFQTDVVDRNTTDEVICYISSQSALAFCKPQNAIRLFRNIYPFHLRLS